MDKQETVYYLEAADGNLMRVPESKLKEFQAMNRKLKENQRQSVKQSQKNFLQKGKPKK